MNTIEYFKDPFLNSGCVGLDDFLSLTIVNRQFHAGRFRVLSDNTHYITLAFQRALQHDQTNSDLKHTLSLLNEFPDASYSTVLASLTINSTEERVLQLYEAILAKFPQCASIQMNFIPFDMERQPIKALKKIESFICTCSPALKEIKGQALCHYTSNNDLLKSLLTLAPNLDTLELSNPFAHNVWHALRDNPLTNLKSLTIGCCSSELLDHLYKNYPLLENLSITGEGHMLPESWKEVKWPPGLRTLSLERLSFEEGGQQQESKEAILSLASRLQSLTITDCKGIANSLPKNLSSNEENNS